MTKTSLKKTKMCAQAYIHKQQDRASLLLFDCMPHYATVPIHSLRLSPFLLLNLFCVNHSIVPCLTLVVTMQRQSMLARPKKGVNLCSNLSPLISSLEGKKKEEDGDTSVKKRGGIIKSGKGFWRRRRGGGEEETRTHWQGREATADRCYCMWASCEDWDASSTVLKAIRIPNAISERRVRHHPKHTHKHMHTKNA